MCLKKMQLTWQGELHKIAGYSEGYTSLGYKWGGTLETSPFGLVKSTRSSLPFRATRHPSKLPFGLDYL